MKQDKNNWPFGDGAVIDDSGQYRYSLTRAWSSEPRICFVMYNPSTADATGNDPTVRRCIAFAKDWDFGSLEIVNLFAYRSPSPQALVGVEDPIGPENETYIRQAIKRAHTVVCAWGNVGDHSSIQHLLCRAHCPVKCLGVTQQGKPRHPLYVPGYMPLTDFRPHLPVYH